MSGTITTVSYCLVDGNIAHTGSKVDILHSVGMTFRFDEDGTLWSKRKFYNEVKHHSYSEDYSEQERYDEAIRYLFSYLCSLSDYKLYRQIRGG